jgi:hypothetical protein
MQRTISGFLRSFCRWALLVATAPLASDCASDADTSAGGYESANPAMPGGPGRGDTGYGGSSSGGGGGMPSGGEGGAARDIEEADIVKFEEQRLYALSRYGGLSVIDISARDRLELLGRHKIASTPFEMYVRDGIVFILYLDYGTSTLDEVTGLWSWHESSSVVVLDAKDPSNITPIGEFSIAGLISDSRIVGDVLYVAAYENGWCWGCDTVPRTNLISLDVSDPAVVTKVDELSFEERTDTYGWRRSLTATDQRLYIAGPEWGTNEPLGSTIQVVDISDAEGMMREAATVEVAGQIQSRWQMDEYDGVLRVVSQPFQWNLAVPPSVQTFTVESSDEIEPLGAAQLVLPEAEQLQSVRFDGQRAYAITFQRTDPLFTIDLSDPAAPRQAAMLTMPGWLYYMEPRGDRLLGLGFDQGNPDGALTVSLFDVADLDQPSMLARVNFGGDWSYLDEDQDRIHKAFNVLDDQGLILVPYAGWDDATSPEYCWGTYSSGVQLIDWQSDELTLRGVAGVTGQARRGVLYDARLFTLSDERVEVFDIADRDLPARTAAIPLAQLVSRTLAAGDELVRIGQNWWTNVTQLDVTSVADAANPGVSGVLEIPQLTRDCEGGSWLSDAFADGGRAYLVYQKYEYDPGSGESSQSSRVVTVDVANGASPAIVSDTTLGFIPGNGYGYVHGLVDSGSGVVALGSTLAFADRAIEYRANGAFDVTRALLQVVDLSDPSAVNVTSVGLPAGLGATGLIRRGSIVATSHYEASPSDPSQVRFYLDRFDLSHPRMPLALGSVNVPGSLLDYDTTSGRAVTVDYERVTIDDVTAQHCYERFLYASFTGPSGYDPQTTPGTCSALVQRLRLVQIDGSAAIVLGTIELGDHESVGVTAGSEDRLFVSISSGAFYGGLVDCYDCGYYWGSSGPMSLLVLAGRTGGGFASGRVELETGNSWGYAPLVASGRKAVLSSGLRGELSVIDAQDPESPYVARTVDVGGYVQHLTVAGGVVVASLGYDGVATVTIDDEY